MHHDKLSRLLRGQKGSALIEMAIVLPLFIFLFIAIVDFGLYFNKRNVAQSAAWNGAKECANGNSPISIVNQTLSYASMANDLVSTPVCSQPSGTYYTVTVTITGNMLSPITSALGLYDIRAVGVSN